MTYPRCQNHCMVASIKPQWQTDVCNGVTFRRAVPFDLCTCSASSCAASAPHLVPRSFGINLLTLSAVWCPCAGHLFGLAWHAWLVACFLCRDTFSDLGAHRPIDPPTSDGISVFRTGLHVIGRHEWQICQIEIAKADTTLSISDCSNQLS